MILKASEDVGKPCERINVVELGGLDQRIDGGGAMAALVRAGEGPVAPPGSHRPHGALGRIVAHAETAIVEEAHESVPVIQAVSDGLADLAAGRDATVLLAQPAAQLVDQGLAALLPNTLPLGRYCAVDLAFYGEQGVDAGDRFDADRRFVETRQVEEVATRMRPTGDLHDRPGLARRLV